MSTKLILSITIRNEDGTEEIAPITVEKDISSLDDFMNGENFRENFDVQEKVILARYFTKLHSSIFSHLNQHTF